MRFAPTNELGVVFLFAHLAKKWRLKIDSIQSEFPDCVAFQKVRGGEKRVQIEFEFRSRNFRTHRHDPDKCDWIVCWEHNWPEAPKHLNIVELRREFGLGFNVWIMPVNDPYKQILDEIGTDATWSLPSQCRKGDLVLFYFTRPQQSIQHLFVADERARLDIVRQDEEYSGPIKRVCRLESPVFMDDLLRHRILSTANFVRSQMQGRHNATEYWPYIYDLIVRRNSQSVSRTLRRYAPESL